MKPTPEQLERLRSLFAEMQSVDDFLLLINAAKLVLYGDEFKAVELKQLTYHAYPRLNARRYQTFTVPKKSGEPRVIHAPNPGLKSILRAVNLILQTLLVPHTAATGFVPGKSIVDNARLHAASHYVYNIDLKDFLPNIDRSRLWGRLQYAPFNLTKGTERGKIGDLIAQLCCHEMEVERQNEAGEWMKVRKQVLPQGAPTSPTITNIICERLDRKLAGLAKRFGVRYSRYADDITFSSLHSVFQKDGEFLKELRRIIADQGFQINDAKTRLQKPAYRQEVTGLAVNENVNVQKRYVKQLRTWLHLWERFGYELARRRFLVAYYADKGHVKNESVLMENVIGGKLLYLKMVLSVESEKYKKLQCRFDKLTKVNQGLNTKSMVNQAGADDTALPLTRLDATLKLLAEQGLDSAMSFYTTAE